MPFFPADCGLVMVPPICRFPANCGGYPAVTPFFQPTAEVVMRLYLFFSTGRGLSSCCYVSSFPANCGPVIVPAGLNRFAVGPDLSFLPCRLTSGWKASRFNNLHQIAFSAPKLFHGVKSNKNDPKRILSMFKKFVSTQKESLSPLKTPHLP